MGNCIGSKTGPVTITQIPTLKTEDPNVKKFKVAQANLVKEKHTDINQDYTFLTILGEGSYGQVKKAVNKATGIVRAIKTINKRRQDTASYNLMMDEINILRNLDHPNIMKIIEFYQDEARIYIVNEFYEGGELFDRLAKKTQFTEVQAATIMRQIFSAVNYCHQNKIVHRDLKLENIVYETNKEDSIIKIVDFGTSLVFRQGELLQKPLGTCYYVAPEVLMKSYTEKCDDWSCGVIMYFILCGHPPFQGPTEKRVLEKVVKGLYEFKDNEWEGISEDAKDLIRKLLEYSPDKRLSSAEALEHPWFKNILGDQKLVNKNMVIKNLKNLEKFKTERKLQEAVWSFLVSYFSTKEEKNKLLETFNALDKDKNGTLTREEIRIGYQKIMGKDYNDEELDALMQNLDANNNGCIEYSEFVSATINKINLLSQNKLEAAFKLFDTNQDGYLTPHELRELLDTDEMMKKYNEEGSDSERGALWEQIFNEVDVNNDGKLSFKEFKDLMMKMLK